MTTPSHCLGVGFVKKAKSVALIVALSIGLVACAPGGEPPQGESSSAAGTSSPSVSAAPTVTSSESAPPVAPPEICEGQPLAPEAVGEVEAREPKTTIPLDNGLTVELGSGSLIWAGDGRSGTIEVKPEHMGVHVDGNHVLVIRADEAVWGLPWELFLWSGENPDEAPKLIGSHPKGGTQVEWTMETLRGNWAAWMASMSMEDRWIEVYDISAGVATTVARGVVARPGFWDDNTVVWLQEEEGAVRLAGMNLQDNQPWPVPEPLRTANINGLEGYVIAPGVFIYTERNSKDEQEFARLWVWRENWAEPLLIDEGTTPQLMFGEKTVSGDHVAFFASQSYADDAATELTVFNLATGAKTKLDVEAEYAGFVDGSLEVYTGKGTLVRRINIADLPSECR